MIPNFQSETINVLWDLSNQNMFVTVSKQQMNTYLMIPHSFDGSQIIHLPEYLRIEELDKPKPGIVTAYDADLKPIILKDGYVYSHARAEGIRGMYLITHSYMNSWRGQSDQDEGHLRYFLQNLACCKYD